MLSLYKKGYLIQEKPTKRDIYADALFYNYATKLEIFERIN
jgi:hypothetical protein